MDRLRKNIVFEDQRFTVTVVQSLEFRTGGWNHKRFLAGSLKPIEVIVKKPDGVRVHFSVDQAPSNAHGDL